MKIYYDSKFEKWYQTGLETGITMGAEKKIIAQAAEAGDEHTNFEVQLKNNHIGPIIGILTVRKPNGSMAGNGTLFIELQKKLISHNGISFIFSPEGVGNEFIDGFTFLQEKNSWIKIKFPFPDLVYNRIPFRKSEQDGYCQKIFSILKEKNIPFFNPSFIDKYDLYCLMKKHTVLKDYLPKTILANQKKELSQFLRKHKSIYLKPAQSAKGKGIFRMKLGKNLQVKLEGINTSEIYQTFYHFWEKWEKVLQEINYLAQEEIKSAHYDGNRFDFRILAHAENEGYSVTGVGIRQSQVQEITTHIPAGGQLLPYQILQTEAHDQFIQTVVFHTGKALSEHFGYFGEFSIDAGVSYSGHYYIFEVNSKPMSFDEKEIEERKIARLCRLFLQLTNFQN
jgi:YheC/D like ATP-grasp